MKPTSSISLLPLVIGALAGLPICSAHAQTKAADPALLAKAKISYAAAEKIALHAVANATIKESELEVEDGGLRWSFDLTIPGSKKITEVGVDALSGKVVENRVEGEKDEANEEKDEKKESPRKKD